MTLDPKTQFLKTPDAKELRVGIGKGWLPRACLTALEELVLVMPPTIDPAEALARYNRLCGARDFIAALLELPNDEPIINPERRDNVGLRRA